MVRKMDPYTEVWFSTQLLTLNDLLYSRTYFSDVIKMMDIFSILQEATSDDN